MILRIKNKSDEWLKFFLKKGRILELAKIESSYYQSIIITEGEGLVLVPPKETIERKIKGICLHKGLKFPPVGARISFTPFVGSKELIKAGNDQKKVHKITDKPLPSIMRVIAKGYSDNKKDGIQKDKKEAFMDAINNAARQSGIIFKSEAIKSRFRLFNYTKSITISEKTIRLLKTIHEEYNGRKGQYLFIGEFEIKIPPPIPEVY